MGILDFPYLELGIRDFKAKSWRDSRLEVCAGGSNAKDNPRDNDIALFLGRDYGIEELTGDALNSFSLI